MKRKSYKLYKKITSISMAFIIPLSFCSCNNKSSNKIDILDDGNALVGIVYDYGKEGLSDDFYGYLKKEDDNIIFVDVISKKEEIIYEDDIIYYSLVTDLLSKNLLKKVNDKGYISIDDLSNVDRCYIPTRVGNGVNLYSDNLKATDYTKLAYSLNKFDEKEYFIDDDKGFFDNILIK